MGHTALPPFTRVSGRSCQLMRIGIIILLKKALRNLGEKGRRKQVRPRTALFVVLLVAVGFRCQQGEAATTADGVVLINEATAATGLPGCPTTGFPIVICHQGSYRLS